MRLVHIEVELHIAFILSGEGLTYKIILSVSPPVMDMIPALPVKASFEDSVNTEDQN
jgi:hypothetical protein